MVFFRPQGGGSIARFPPQGGGSIARLLTESTHGHPWYLWRFSAEGAKKLELELKLSSLKNAIKSKNLGVWG